MSLSHWPEYWGVKGDVSWLAPVQACLFLWLPLISEPTQVNRTMIYHHMSSCPSGACTGRFQYVCLVPSVCFPLSHLCLPKPSSVHSLRTIPLLWPLPVGLCWEPTSSWSFCCVTRQNVCSTAAPLRFRGLLDQGRASRLCKRGYLAVQVTLIEH